MDKDKELLAKHAIVNASTEDRAQAKRAEVLLKAREHKPITAEDILELEITARNAATKKERLALAEDRKAAQMARRAAEDERRLLEKERAAYIASSKEVPDGPVLPLDEIANRLRQKHLAALEKFGNSVDFTEVGHQIMADFNSQKRAVVLAMLGMDNAYGRWEVKDYDKTPLGNMLKENVGTVLHEWVQQAVKEVFTDEKQNQIRNLLKNAVRKYLADQTIKVQGYNMETQVRELLNDLSHEVLTDVRKELNLPEAPKKPASRF